MPHFNITAGLCREAAGVLTMDSFCIALEIFSVAAVTKCLVLI